MKIGHFVAVCALAVTACGAPEQSEQVELDDVANATHAWGSYHWARTSNPFTLKLGDNVTSQWDSYLATTSSDWTQSNVLNTTIVAGQAGSVRKCRATAGRAEICNATYGNNGWLGIAQIWASGSHITQGVVKMNDTYFNTATYNTPAWRNLVMCQEVGHIFGLNHQDENFSNPPLGTCMDYSNDPVPNQHPNQHDYDMLSTIYSHLDSTTTVGALLPNENLNSPEAWGAPIGGQNGREHTWVRDLGQGRSLITFVVWAE